MAYQPGYNNVRIYSPTLKSEYVLKYCGFHQGESLYQAFESANPYRLWLHLQTEQQIRERFESGNIEYRGSI